MNRAASQQAALRALEKTYPEEMADEEVREEVLAYLTRYANRAATEALRSTARRIDELVGDDDLTGLEMARLAVEVYCEARNTPARRGRPPIEEEPRSRKLHVRCTPSARERWRLAADTAGVELAEIVRDYLDDWSERVLTEEQ